MDLEYERQGVSPPSICRPGSMRRLFHSVMFVGAFAMATTGIASAQQLDAGSLADMERLGPKRDLSVYWVGHSLVEAKTRSEWGENSLMTLVERFAESRGLGYRMGDHTLWGSSLSALWRGQPHNYKRDASTMIAKREAFEKSAGRYDTLVLTEGLPLASSLSREYSAYYLRRFYCTLLRTNPTARVYLYESWLNYQGADAYSNFPPPHRFDWREEMVAQQRDWERLRKAAARRAVRAPGWLDRIGWTTNSNAGCDIEAPIYLVPVGQALIALLDQITKSPAQDDGLTWPDGTRLSMGDLFSNPYVDWPAEWPLRNGTQVADAASRLASLRKRDPARDHDDIHPSALGIYFNALVHFATLFRQSPVGLPAAPSIGDRLARALQCIAWRTVVNEPRAGVAGELSCS